MPKPQARLLWPPFVRDLADLLRRLDVQHPVYLVGGAVRDAYLRAPILDVDVAVAGDSIALARAVADRLGGALYIMDREREVARVFLPPPDADIAIDFARFRGATLAADLRDRDFTMNAMAADLLGDIERLVDPLGGIEDLRRKALRRCSPAAIAADPLRALRAVRFCAQFQLKLEPATRADIRRHAAGLKQVSGERIRDEFFKLLGLERAARGLRVLQHLRLLDYILPAAALPAAGLAETLSVVDRLSAILKAISQRRTDNTAAAFDLGTLVMQLDRFRAALQRHISRKHGNGRSHSQLLLLAALLHRGDALSARQRASASAEQLRLSKAEMRGLAVALQHYAEIGERESWTPLAQHRFWHRLGENGIDAILLGCAQVLGSRRGDLAQAEWLRLVEAVTILLDTYFNRYDEIVAPPPLLDGRDICDLLGIQPGPAVGELLTALREAQVTRAVKSVDEARAFLLEQAARA